MVESPHPRSGEADLPRALTRTLDTLTAVVRAKNVTLLIGPAGAGKTTTLRLLARALLQQGQAAALVTPADELPRRGVALLLDDAHLLDAEAWLQVSRRGGAVVLAGSLALLGRKPDIRRRLEPVMLPAIDAADMPAYVAFMLREMNEPPELVRPSAVHALAEAAEGLPRRAAAILRMAAYLARLEGAGRVEHYHVTRAAALEIEDAEAIAPNPDPAPASAAPTAVPRAAPLLAGLFGIAVLALPGTMAPGIRPVLQAAPAAVDAGESPAVFVNVAPKPPTEAAIAVPPTMAALPVPPSLHITVLVPPDDARARSSAATMAVLLRDRGYAVADPVTSAARSANPEVRYFFAEDAAAADILARTVGASPAVLRSDTEQHRLPRPGSAEIVAGGSNGARDH